MKENKEEKNRSELTVITTHSNADFDGFASLLAAQKLYPDSVVVFGGTQDATLKNFFMSSMIYLFNLESASKIDLNAIETLVLVDTRQKHRIGKLAQALDRPEVRLHIYDHHPPAPGDLKGSLEVSRRTGATVTILTELLIERGINISADEATVLCLGIYEDTGSFSYSSTTKEDLLAAAHLVGCGADLNAVANVLARDYSPEQITLLNDLIRSTVVHSIHGNEVAVCSLSIDHYFADFAVLVHRLMKMESMDAVIAMARMGDRIHLVGRSRIPEVDVGKVVRNMGGGGHGFAAAATIKDKTLIQVEAKLLELLHKHVEPRQKARDIMSTPAISADQETTIKKAASLLTQYNINALCVTAQGNGASPRKLKGVISRQVLEKALHHHLEDLPVREYMTTDPVTVTPDDGLADIKSMALENKQRILPVMDDGALVGVISRTDILNLLLSRASAIPEAKSDQPPSSFQEQTRKASKMMNDRVPAGLLDLIKAVGRTADEVGVNAFVVGGFVRDLLLSRKNEDIDVVVEGDGIAFAKVFAKLQKARVHSHAVFGTAVVTMPDGFKIDVASARFEYYDSPASLPVVETSSLKMDLYRRDFTVNTMAIQINEKSFGSLIDFFGAQKDLKAKSIRVLHNLSFVEDPTRVFRAIRFEQRFGFKIGKLTSGLIRNAVKMDFFQHLSGRRLFTELRLILEEENPGAAVARMAKYKLLPIIHPALHYNKNMYELFESTREVLNWHDLLFLGDSYKKWAVNLLALFAGCDTQQVYQACDQLEMPPRHRGLFLEHRKMGGFCLARLERNGDISNSDLYRLLIQLPLEVLLHMMAGAKSRSTKKLISLYFTQLRTTECLLTGRMIKEMGVKPGPIYKQMLDAALNARLDGEAETLEDEMKIARKMVKNAG